MNIRKRLFGWSMRNVRRMLAQQQEDLKFHAFFLDERIREDESELLALKQEEAHVRAEIEQCRKRIEAALAHPRSSPLFPPPDENPPAHLPEPSPESDEPPKPAVRLGDALIRNGLITDEQLARAIAVQKESGGRLGDILVDMNMVGHDDLNGVVQHIPRKSRLGDLLLESGIVTKEQLDLALEFQRKSGGMLGDILTSLRIVSAEKLFRLIANQSGIGRVGENISKSSISMDIPKLPEEWARSLNAVIINERASRYLVAVGELLSPEAVERIEQFVSRRIEQVLATREELEQFWKVVYQEELVDKSTFGLMLEQPDNSAHHTFTAPQLVAMAVLAVIIGFGFVVNWIKTFIILNVIVQCFYFVMTLFKFLIIAKGAQENAQLRFTEEEVAAIDERELPVYTILVPMYKESQVIPYLINNLEKLDYPKAKLDIRLLIEEDDVEAQEMLRGMNLPPYYTTLVVPDSLPKTKPKACNYGLIRARGAYVVIYDAEDRPDPDQLKKAYLAFRSSPDHIVCVQAKLNYFNSNQNLLTKWFTHEYSMWFELLLPGVMKLNIPIPLGGTSNHFKMEPLKKINAWDPYNVTEDADLGIRLYKEGYQSAIIDSRTWEEANSRVGNWLRQRSRWIKGYMQTWLVHMRNPFRLWKEIGFRGFLGFQVMVLATPTLPLLNPFYWFLIVMWYATQAQFIPMLFPGVVYYMAAFGLFVGNFFFIFSNVAGVYWVIEDMEKKGDMHFSYSLVKYALLTPVYWFLMSIAAIKAAWQLVTKPFYWEKTDHGLSEHHLTSLESEQANPHA